MNLYLTRFEESDLDKLDVWCKRIQAEQFMSRVTPEAYTRGSGVQNELWDWYIINQNDLSIGTIWLEKSDTSSDVAKLGILLGSQDLFEKGIGSQTVLLAIESSHRRLGFNRVQLNVRKSNIRAISCYKKCGFSIVGEGTKFNKADEKIEFYTMQCSTKYLGSK